MLLIQELLDAGLDFLVLVFHLNINVSRQHLKAFINISHHCGLELRWDINLMWGSLNHKFKEIRIYCLFFQLWSGLNVFQILEYSQAKHYLTHLIYN